MERFTPVKDRLKMVGQRLQTGIASSWTNHRIPTIAVSAIVVVAILAGGVLIVARPGSYAAATQSAGTSVASSGLASFSPSTSFAAWFSSSWE